MAHTPGPWQFYELPNSQGRDGLGYIRTVPEDGLEIAHHGDSGRSWSENVCNAHLVAAAPDLLAALQGARITIAVAIGEDDPLYTAVMPMIDAAIAKAGGKP